MVVLFCCGDSFEEDLRYWTKLGVFVGLVELDDEVDDAGDGTRTRNPSITNRFHFSTVTDFSSEKYSRSTGHRNSWYQ